MKKERKFMLVIALLLTVLPLVGCGEKAKETEIKKYKEDSYIEVSDDTKSDFWKGVIKSYVTDKRTIIVRQHNNEEGSIKYVIYGYDYEDHDYENILWTYETISFYEGNYLNTIQNPDNMNIIFVIENEKVSALDANTGKIKWSNKSLDTIITDYLVNDGKLYSMNRYHTDKIIVLDIETGKLLKTLNVEPIHSFKLEITGLIEDELIITDYEDKTIYSLNINTGSIKESDIIFSIKEEFYE